MEMQIVMWAYHEKANGSLLFLLEFNLKVFFRENNTTIRVCLTFSGERQFTEKTIVLSDSEDILYKRTVQPGERLF